MLDDTIENGMKREKGLSSLFVLRSFQGTARISLRFLKLGCAQSQVILSACEPIDAWMKREGHCQGKGSMVISFFFFFLFARELGDARQRKENGPGRDVRVDVDVVWCWMEWTAGQ